MHEKRVSHQVCGTLLNYICGKQLFCADFSAGYIVEDASAADVEDAVTEELLRLVFCLAPDDSCRSIVVVGVEHDAPREGDVVRQSVIGAAGTEDSVILDDIETVDGAIQHDGGVVRLKEELVVRAEERETAVRSGDGYGLSITDGDTREIGLPDILGLRPLDEIGHSGFEVVCLLEGDGEGGVAVSGAVGVHLHEGASREDGVLQFGRVETEGQAEEFPSVVFEECSSGEEDIDGAVVELGNSTVVVGLVRQFQHGADAGNQFDTRQRVQLTVAEMAGIGSVVGVVVVPGGASHDVLDLTGGERLP